jgi:predicted dehydrogenase
VTLRIGILGAARVATYAMIDAARAIDGVEVQAVAARDPGRASVYAAELGIAKVYPDYQALIEADDVDAVYVALPPNLHARWSIAAVEAGKPVLCEKPFALLMADVEAMLAAETRTGVLIMEAQHSHYHPLSARMREIIRSGQLGAISSFAASFVAPLNLPDDDLRMIGDVGGGALWDLGVYPAYWIRSAFGEEPVVLSAKQKLNGQGADLHTSARLQLPSGAIGTLECNLAAEKFGVWFNATGSLGSLQVRNPLSPQNGHALTVQVDGNPVEEQFSTKSTYAFQLEAFRDNVLDGVPVPTRGDDSLNTIRLLSAIRDTAKKEVSDDG